MNIRNRHLFIISLSVGLVLFFGGYNYHIYGYNFKKRCGMTALLFLALLNEMQIEMNLINTNLIGNNLSLAKYHLKELKELYTENIKKELIKKK